jgi:hypothetical protein
MIAQILRKFLRIFTGRSYVNEKFISCEPQTTLYFACFLCYIAVTGLAQPFRDPHNAYFALIQILSMYSRY